MKVKVKNIVWKLSQSFFGVLLIMIQSRYMDIDDLVVFTLGQAVITSVPLFDFGVGVRLSTWMTSAFRSFDTEPSKQRILASKMLSACNGQLLLTALIQGIVFEVAFYILTHRIGDDQESILHIVFFFVVVIHSYGVNSSKVFVSTGQITLLVKFQTIGGLAGLFMGLMGIKSNYNLFISVFALCMSSAVMVIASNFPRKSLTQLEIEQLEIFLHENPGRKKILWQPTLQISQSLQFLQNLLIQILLTTNLRYSQIVAYMLLQKIFGAIANALSSETQLNYTLGIQPGKFKKEVILRFKNHFAILVVASAFAISIVNLLWKILFPSVANLNFLSEITFPILSLCLFIDQANRIRLYVLEKFRTDLFSNIFQLTFFLFVTAVIQPSSVAVFNMILISSYFFKFSFIYRF